MTNSLRRDILEQMASVFRAIDTVDGAGDPTDWPLKFSAVHHGPLDDSDHRQAYALGIVPQPEEYGHLYPYITRTLQVGIEYRITINRGDEVPALAAERVLEVVERAVLQNTTWGGLAIDTQLVGNDTDLTNYADRTVFGVLVCRVQYRHGQRDPRDPSPSFGA